MSDVEVKVENILDVTALVKPRTKRRNYVKKVEHEWAHDEIIQLIAAVKKRRVLWDIGTPEYRLPKATAWEEVTNAIGNIKVDDAKAKWMNLRITFKNNMAKYRSKKLKQGADEAVIIHWRYFKSLLFLEANYIQQSNELASSLPLASDNSEASVLSDLSVPPPSPPVAVGGKRKRGENPGPSPTPSPTPSVNPIRELALNMLSSLKVQDDTFSAFGNYIASELRGLPPHRAVFVQRGLNRELLRLLEVAESLGTLMPQRSSV